MSQEIARFGVSIPAAPRYLQALRAFLKCILAERCGAATDDLVLALDESCANVLRHNFAAISACGLHLEVELGPELARFRIRDFCGDKDVGHIRPRDLTDVKPGGLGTHFVSQLMDRVEFEPQPGRPGVITLVMEKKLPPRDQAAAQKPGERS